MPFLYLPDIYGEQNKRQAFRILRSRLLDLRRRARQDEIAAKRKSQLKGWGKADRIRTYNRQAVRKPALLFCVS